MAEPRRARLRRPLAIAATVIAGVVIYALAVDRVGVDLGEIQSETRQNQLVRIIRNLFNPELTTQEVTEESVTAPVAVPCGPTASGRAQSPLGSLTVEPACAEPEATVTVSGHGFEPGGTGRLVFIPQSDVAGLFLPLEPFAVDAGGAFSAQIAMPTRTADVAQAIEARVRTPLGTWTDRVEVWEDTNENGIRDEGVLVDGNLSVTVEGVSVESPGIALLDDTRQVVELVTTGTAFEAVNGQALGQVAIPLAERETEPPGVYVADISSGSSSTTVTLAGPDGADVSGWLVAIYDGTTGEIDSTAPLGDVVRLSPRVSESTTDTIDKIIDTVFLALVATTVGLVVAVPLSFLSARNLMRDISTPTIGLGLGLLALPAGIYLGVLLSRAVRAALAPLGESAWTALVALVMVAALIATVVRWGLNRPEEASLGRAAALFAAGVLGLAGVALLGRVLLGLGQGLRPLLGPLGFVAGLFSTLGEVTLVILPLLAALAGAGVLVTISNRLGYHLRDTLTEGTRTFLILVLSALAGALWAALLGAAVKWLYQLDNPVATLWVPAAVGAVIGLVIGGRGLSTGEVRTGLTVYYVSRTIFNTLRSIEPLVMAIVFVVWVGFGEFAGSLALALHTAAALAKLYSEQVESIAPGPMEAIRATGATRLQSVVYAVVPQIVPPYISFTMYRWDINVRMSTILGFVGGGGIGFILQQNVQLGNYRAAAVQMLAIAIVVASMDWLSAKLRERLV